MSCSPMADWDCCRATTAEGAADSLPAQNAEEGTGEPRPRRKHSPIPFPQPRQEPASSAQDRQGTSPRSGAEDDGSKQHEGQRRPAEGPDRHNSDRQPQQPVRNRDRGRAQAADADLWNGNSRRPHRNARPCEAPYIDHLGKQGRGQYPEDRAHRNLDRHYLPHQNSGRHPRDRSFDRPDREQPDVDMPSGHPPDEFRSRDFADRRQPPQGARIHHTGGRGRSADLRQERNNARSLHDDQRYQGGPGWSQHGPRGPHVSSHQPPGNHRDARDMHPLQRGDRAPRDRRDHEPAYTADLWERDQAGDRGPRRRYNEERQRSLSQEPAGRAHNGRSRSRAADQPAASPEKVAKDPADLGRLIAIPAMLYLVDDHPIAHHASSACKSVCMLKRRATVSVHMPQACQVIFMYL